jgi:protein-disulfide isomerase
VVPVVQAERRSSTPSPLSGLASGAATVAMLVMAALMLIESRGPREPREPVAVSSGRDVPDWKRFVSPADVYLESDTALVEVVVFSDYQCPACRSFHIDLTALLNEGQEDVRVSARHYPLRSSGSTSLDAARLAICAASNRRFPAVHDALLASPIQNLVEQRARWAVLAGYEREEGLEDCMSSPWVAERIRADLAAKDALEIKGTPSYLINGKLYSGVMDPDDLRRIVRYALVESRAVSRR